MELPTEMIPIRKISVHSRRLITPPAFGMTSGTKPKSSHSMRDPRPYVRMYCFRLCVRFTIMENGICSSAATCVIAVIMPKNISFAPSDVASPTIAVDPLLQMMPDRVPKRLPIRIAFKLLRMV